MIFPTWVIFGLCAAFLSAGTMLMQEKFKVNGFALVFWNKIALVLVTLPFMIHYGFPQQPMFYGLMVLSALLYAVSDVVFYRTIPLVGAGTVSRLLPASVIFSFLLWFAVSPGSFSGYLAKPVVTVLILLVLCCWVYFATNLRKCSVSMQAAKTVWFVIFAAIVGPPLSKEIVNTTDMVHGTYGFPFVQGMMMLATWCIFFTVRKPVSRAVLFSRTACQYGLMIGCVNAISVILGAAALYYIDNPAYFSAVSYLNSFIIVVVYGLQGRKSDGNVIAGLGMVACAAALIILKAQI